MKENKAMQALFKIQKQIYEDNDFISKDSDNPFFKSKYADLPSIQKKVIPMFLAEGCLVSHTTRVHESNPEILVIGTVIHHSETGHERKNEIPVHASELKTVETKHRNDGKVDTVSVTTILRAQDIGQHVTYHSRYTFFPMLGIPATKDDDGEKAMGRGAQREEKPAKAKSVDPFEYLSEQTGMTVKAVKDRLKFLGFDTVNKVKAAGAAKLIKMLKENNEDE